MYQNLYALDEVFLEAYMRLLQTMAQFYALIAIALFVVVFGSLVWFGFCEWRWPQAGGTWVGRPRDCFRSARGQACILPAGRPTLCL